MSALVLFLAAFSGAGVKYFDKLYIDKGVSPKKFIFIKTIATVFISAALFLFTPFRIEIKIIAFLLVLFNSLLRISATTFGARSLKHISALELSTYSSLAVIFTYIIDILIGVDSFSFISLIALFMVIFSSFIMAKNEIKIRKISLDLISRIVLISLRGYVTYYALFYMNNITFIFLTFLFSSFILLPFFKKFNNPKIKSYEWRFAFISQIFAIFSFYLSNILASVSPTLYMLVRPATIIFLIFISYLLYKKENKKLKLYQIICSLFIVLGILLFAIF